MKTLIIGLSLLVGVTGYGCASPACQITIHSDDQIRWDTPDIKVSKSCDTFTVTLIHDGHLDKGVMGHNWVLTRAEDSDVVLRALIPNKETDYLSDDPRIIAHTKLLGGGQISSTTFEVSKLQADQAYRFFCSYPEHVGLMQGTLELID